MIMIFNFSFNFTNFCVIVCFCNETTNMRYFDIRFSTVVNSDLLTKLLTSGILFSTSAILELKSAFTTKLLTLGILFSTASKASLLTTPLPCFSIFSIFELSALYLVFQRNPVVSILSALPTNLSYSVLSYQSFFTTLVNFAKSLEIGTNLSVSNFSTLGFKLAKFVFSTKLLTSTCVTFFRSVFVA